MHTFLFAAATALTVAPLERSTMPVDGAEAMQRLLAANPGWHQATRPELRSMGVPDSVDSVVTGCWGPGTYGDIIHCHPDSHRHIRERLGVGLDSSSDVVGVTERTSPRKTTVALSGVTRRVVKQAWSTTKTCTGLWTTWRRVTTTGASGAG